MFREPPCPGRPRGRPWRPHEPFRNARSTLLAASRQWLVFCSPSVHVGTLTQRESADKEGDQSLLKQQPVDLLRFSLDVKERQIGIHFCHYFAYRGKNSLRIGRGAQFK